MSYLPFQTMYERCQTLSNDSDTASLTLFKALINEGVTKAEAELDEEYFYSTATDTTVADTDSYPLPYNCAKLHTLKVTVSDVDYPVKEFSGSDNEWISLTGGISSSTSDYPTYYFVKRNTYEIYPMSSTADYTITMKYKVTTKDLSADNHTTESIKTATAGSTAIVGNTGTTWTTGMAGRYLKITADGIWYEISSVTTATAIVLNREFGGTSITAGTSKYTIGEMSLIPEPYQILPVYYALKEYFAQKRKLDLAQYYDNKWNIDLQKMIQYGSNSTTSEILEENINIVDPNDYPTGLAES